MGVLAKIPGMKALTRRMFDSVQPYGPQARNAGGAGTMSGHVGATGTALAPSRPITYLPTQIAECRQDYDTGSPYLRRYLLLVRMLTLGGRGLRPQFPTLIMREWDAFKADTTRTQSVSQFQKMALLNWEISGEILSDDTGAGFTIRDSLELWGVGLNQDLIIRDPLTQRPLAYPFRRAGVVVPAQRMTAEFNLVAGRYRGEPVAWPALRYLRLLDSLDDSYASSAIRTASEPLALALDEDMMTIYVDEDTDEAGIRRMLTSASNVSPGDVKVIAKDKMEYKALGVSATMPSFYDSSRAALIEASAGAVGMPRESFRGSFSDAVFASLKAAYRENMALIDEKRRVVERVSRPVVGEFIRTLSPYDRRAAMRAADQEWQLPVFMALDENKQASAHQRYLDMGAISLDQVRREIDVDPERMAAEIMREMEAAKASTQSAPTAPPAGG